jgi:amino acid adenylation domain-containing protein
VLPLSFAQRRLWFLNRLEGPSATYNVPLALRFSGRVDTVALGGALADVVGRHEALRTVFPEVDGEPFQRVISAGEAVPVVEVTTVAEDGLTRALEVAAGYHFDLAAEIPLRAHVFVVSEVESVLLLVMHHIVSDGWSMGPLLRDLSDAYAARCEGRVPGWEELPVQYADYALWQREVLGDESDPDSVLTQQSQFWREALAGAPDLLELPTDRPRPAVASYRGASVPFEIDAELHARLLEVAKARGCTLYMVLQAALAALLTRLGAGTDIPIGSAIAGRSHEALNDLVGFFVNTLVLRTDTSGDPTFTQLLDRVREGDLAAYAHQDLPFERLVEILNPPRSLARHPLFQVMLVLQNTDSATTANTGQFPGLTVTPSTAETAISKFDLLFSLRERQALGATFGGGMSAVLEFSTDLFDEDGVQLLARRFVRMLDAVASTPEMRIGQAALLEADERNRVLSEWNGTARDTADVDLVELFQAQAARAPEAMALLFDGTSLSYAELDARSDHLARILTEQGMGPERFAALMLPRSQDLVVALLAVLKSGGAYLPIDQGFPTERIEYMLAQTQPALVLDEHWLAAAEEREPQLEARLHTTVDGSQAAYVLYTSGSTGQPKGVVISRAALTNLLCDMRQRIPLTDQDRLLAVTTISFDIAGLELLTPLISGAAVVLAPSGLVHDPSALHNVINRERVTVMQATPSLWRAVVTAPNAPRTLARVRALVGGEVLPPDLAELLVHCAAEVTNVYGPTETTIWSTAANLTTDSAVTIGHPLANTRAYVLDVHLQPVPTGVPGELYIAGTGVARGYQHQPALTAGRFVANPLGPPGSRMYRTGDFVRWNDTGQLEYLRRADTQVKVRGFRVELGEIEAAVRRQPSVDHAAVAVRDDRLVAYVVGTGQTPVDVALVREHVAAVLPDYMVPSTFVLLDALPLTPNGKLDHKQLPTPDYATNGGRAPRSEQEVVLCGLFAEVLGVEEVSIDDGFFDLGGHSLLATRLISRIRALVGAEISVRTLFEAPTVATLVEQLGHSSQGDALSTLLPLRTFGQRLPIFCVHPAGGTSWCYSGLLQHFGPDYPLYGIQARGLNDNTALPQSIEEMASDYVEEILTVQPDGPYRLIGWSIGGTIAHAMAIELQKLGRSVEFLAMLDSTPHPIPGQEDLEGNGGVLRGIMEAFGAETGWLGESPRAEQVIEALQKNVSILGSLEFEVIQRVLDTALNTSRVFGLPRSVGLMEGDLYFYAAVGDREGISPDAATLWEEYFTGQVHVDKIDCSHGEMTAPEPLAAIASTLVARVRELEWSRYE